MEEFKIYSVSDQYIEYLRQFEPNVYSNKSEDKAGAICYGFKKIFFHCMPG